MAGSLVVLTGASGSGKTTLARAVDAAASRTIFFDSIGVPSAEVMASFGTGHQPGGAWQRAMTMHWIDHIALMLQAGESVLFEGQMRIAFIHEALAARDILDARIVLVDCADAIRASRLLHDRQQPELADENMMGWARYLREEARRTGCEILDTGVVPFARCVEVLRSYVSSGLFADTKRPEG